MKAHKYTGHNFKYLHAVAKAEGEVRIAYDLACPNCLKNYRYFATIKNEEITSEVVFKRKLLMTILAFHPCAQDKEPRR